MKKEVKTKGRVVRVSKNTELRFKKILLYNEEKGKEIKPADLAEELFALGVETEFEKIV